MLNFILGGAGCGKSYLMMQKINQFINNGNEVIFIVPEQFSFETDKKLYNFLGSKNFNKILSVSFTSLAKEIFEKFGSRSGEYAEDIHKFILMNKAIKELEVNKSLQYFNKQSRKINFIGDALKIVTEFRQCGILSEEFMRFVDSANNKYNEKIYDLALIYYTYDNMLKENHLKDSLTDISEAAAIANLNDFFDGRIVFIDEFESFTGDEYEMTETIISQSKDVFTALRLENIGENQYGVFDSVEKTWKSFYQTAKKYNIEIVTENLKNTVKYKNDDLAYLNKNIFRNFNGKQQYSENISIIECRDLYEEADYISSQIKELVMNQNYLFSDIAILSRQLNEYTYILEAAFRKYNIPYFMDIKKSAYHTVIMQLVINAVNILCEARPDTETILKYIKTQLNDITIKEISEIENYCFEWDIRGEQWFSPFTAEIEKKSGVENTRKKVMEPIINLRNKCKGADCKKICKSIYEFLYETKVPIRVSELCGKLNDMGLTYQAKEQKRIWDILMSVLNAISEIGGAMTMSEFHHLFTAVIKQITYSIPPQTLDGVHIAGAETARLDSPKAVFVLGVNEGYFPMASHKSGLLNEKDRMKFEMSGLRLSRNTDELISDEKLIVYKTLTYASDKLFISYPLSDNTGSSRYPASVLTQIRNMFKNEILSSASDKDIVFYSSTPQAAYYNYIQNFSRSDSKIESLRTVLKDYPYYTAKIDYLKKVSSQKEFHIEDANLIKRIYTDSLNISATGIEEFNLCHFKFFCNSGLKLKVRRKRQIGSLEQGNLIHQCLECVLSSCKNKEEFDKLSRNQISKIIEKCADDYFESNMGGVIKRNARLESNLKRIKENIFKIISHLQNELKQSEFRPINFEFNINEKGIANLTGDNGIEIVIRGVIDRVDIYESNGEKYIRVIDYKTGKKIFSMSSLLYGINLQMLLYMFTITGSGGAYSDCNPAGVLYMPSGEIVCGRDRDESDNMEEYLNKHYKMNGVVLNDRAVLNAMEKDIQGIYIPAKLLKGDTGDGELLLNKRSSSCLTSSQFKKLRQHTEKIIIDVCNELYSGNIDADPLVISGGSPCDYCDYWSVCGNVPCEKYREADKNAEEEMLKIISD